MTPAACKHGRYGPCAECSDEFVEVQHAELKSLRAEVERLKEERAEHSRVRHDMAVEVERLKAEAMLVGTQLLVSRKLAEERKTEVERLTRERDDHKLRALRNGAERDDARSAMYSQEQRAEKAETERDEAIATSGSERDQLTALGAVLNEMRVLWGEPHATVSDMLLRAKCLAMAEAERDAARADRRAYGERVREALDARLVTLTGEWDHIDGAVNGIESAREALRALDLAALEDKP